MALAVRTDLERAFGRWGTVVDADRLGVAVDVGPNRTVAAVQRDTAAGADRTGTAAGVGPIRTVAADVGPNRTVAAAGTADQRDIAAVQRDTAAAAGADRTKPDGQVPRSGYLLLAAGRSGWVRSRSTS